jgi:hypothetical protein
MTNEKLKKKTVKLQNDHEILARKADMETEKTLSHSRYLFFKKATKNARIQRVPCKYKNMKIQVALVRLRVSQETP